MDRGAWWAIVHGAATSQTWLSNWHFHFTSWKLSDMTEWLTASLHFTDISLEIKYSKYFSLKSFWFVSYVKSKTYLSFSLYHVSHILTLSHDNMKAWFKRMTWDNQFGRHTQEKHSICATVGFYTDLSIQNRYDWYGRWMRIRHLMCINLINVSFYSPNDFLFFS